MKSVVQALPTYTMQTAILPRSVCDQVDKMCNSFVWGDSDSQRKVHLVAWDELCLPKNLGGLGLRDMTNFNKVAAMKVGGRLCTRRDDL